VLLDRAICILLIIFELIDIIQAIRSLIETPQGQYRLSKIWGDEKYEVYADAVFDYLCKSDGRKYWN